MPGKAKKHTLGSKFKGQAEGHDLECPSGETCRVRRPGVQGLIAMGLLDDMDQLTALVQIEHFNRVDGKISDPQAAKDALAAFAENSDKVKAGLDMVAKLVVGCVIEPILTLVPKDAAGADIPMELRNVLPAWTEDTVYVDQVDMEDQVFIMQYVMGGVADLTPFRAELAENMGRVVDVQDAPMPAKRAPRSRGAASGVLPESSGDDVRGATGRGTAKRRAPTGRA